MTDRPHPRERDSTYWVGVGVAVASVFWLAVVVLLAVVDRWSR